MMKCIEIKYIDWITIVNEIVIKTGTKFSVAEMVGVGWSTAQKWFNGSEPSYYHGQALLELHAHFYNKKATKKITDAALPRSQRDRLILKASKKLSMQERKALKMKI